MDERQDHSAAAEIPLHHGRFAVQARRVQEDAVPLLQFPPAGGVAFAHGDIGAEGIRQGPFVGGQHAGPLILCLEL